MRPNDVRKVSEIIGKLLKSVNVVHTGFVDGITKFHDFKLKFIDGHEEAFRIFIQRTGMMVVINQKLLGQLSYETFLNRFEYDLEQAFFRNIRMETLPDEGANHRFEIEI